MPRPSLLVAGLVDVILAASFVLGRPGGAATPPRLGLQPVARGLFQPVYVTAPRSEPARQYVVERPGLVRVVRSGKVAARPFLDVRGLVAREGERGLLSIAFPPDYAANRRVYAFFTRGEHVEVHEYRVDGGRAVLATDRLVVGAPHPDSPFHNGGQLAFGPDGLLYAGIGDGGYDAENPRIPDPNGNSQNLSVLLGKILRIDVADPTAKPQIVAYGLRNPWRFSFDPDGDLVIGDVGWNRFEEVDVLPRGAGLTNFGWSVYEGRAARRPGTAPPLNEAGTLRFPVLTYGTHSRGNCSIVGGYVYRGRAAPSLRGRYVFGDYCTGRIWSVALDAGRARGLRLERLPRLVGLTSFGEDASGELYVATMRRGERGTGAVFKFARS